MTWCRIGAVGSWVVHLFRGFFCFCVFFFYLSWHVSAGKGRGLPLTARSEQACFSACAFCKHRGSLYPSRSFISSRLSLSRRHLPRFHELFESPQILFDLLCRFFSEELRHRGAE